MRRLSVRPAGDTLIEVIFAFAILASLIGLSFSGLVSAHKATTAALNRTQALEAAQYQSEALLMYRNSLPWDNSGGVPNSFLTGNGGPNMPNLQNYANNNTAFCLLTFTPLGGGAVSPDRWKIDSTAAGCNASTVAPGLQAPAGLQKADVRLAFTNSLGSTVTATGVTDTIRATVTINYVSVYGINEKVTNVTLITKSQ